MKKHIPVGGDTIAIINEVAKYDPAVLTAALRAAGNWVYLIHPDDIMERVNGCPNDYGDLQDLNDSEVREALSDGSFRLGDIVDYGTITADIVEYIRFRRERSAK